MVYDEVALSNSFYKDVTDLNAALVDYLLDTFHIIGFNKQLYIFKDGCYVRDDEALKRAVHQLYANIGKKYVESNFNIVYSLMLAYCTIDSTLVNANEDYIPFLNGYLNVKTMQLEEPNPKLYFTYQIKYNYKKAECPVFLQFLKDCVTNEPSAPYQDRLLIMLAVCFTTSINLSRALMLYGPGGNGKSKLLDWLDHTLQNVACSVQLKCLGDRFNIMLYMHKLVNIYDDISHEDLETDSYIKTYTGKQYLEGEIKGVQDHPHYKNTCHHIFSCNQIPAPKFNASQAFWDRWVIIPFLNRIRGTAKEDPYILDKLIAETEGIIYHILSFLPRKEEIRLITTAEVQQQWLRWGESCYAFYEACEKNEKYDTPTQELFELYQEFCKETKTAPASFKKFGMVLGQLGISKDRRHEDGTWVYYYEGIQYKKPVKEFAGTEEIPENYTDFLDEVLTK